MLVLLVPLALLVLVVRFVVLVLALAALGGLEGLGRVGHGHFLKFLGPLHRHLRAQDQITLRGAAAIQVSGRQGQGEARGGCTAPCTPGHHKLFDDSAARTAGTDSQLAEGSNARAEGDPTASSEERPPPRLCPTPPQRQPPLVSAIYLPSPKPLVTTLPPPKAEQTPGRGPPHPGPSGARAPTALPPAALRPPPPSSALPPSCSAAWTRAPLQTEPASWGPPGAAPWRALHRDGCVDGWTAGAWRVVVWRRGGEGR